MGTFESGARSDESYRLLTNILVCRMLRQSEVSRTKAARYMLSESQLVLIKFSQEVVGLVLTLERASEMRYLPGGWRERWARRVPLYAGTASNP
jgi:hypothetical protein